MNIKYDIIVIGSGISGPMVSKYASLNDTNVLLIDKKKEIGIPIQCAGFIPHYTELKKLIPSFNVPKELVNIPDYCVQSIINKQKIYIENYSKSFSLNGYIVNRMLFDQYLTNNACNSGSELLCNTKAISINKNKIKTIGILGKKEFESKLIVGADGPNSIVKKYINLNSNIINKTYNHRYSCFQYQVSNINIDPNEIKIFFSKNIIPNGYCWIFPYGNDKATVGIGTNLKCANVYHSTKYLLDRFINNHKIANKILKNSKILSVNTGFVPLFNFENTTFENKLLVGDAASHVMSTNGGGIPFALEGGKIAGLECSKYINLDSKIQNYEIKWKNEFGTNLENSVFIKNIIELLIQKNNFSLLLNIIPNIYLKKFQCGTNSKILNIIGNFFNKNVK